MRYTLTMTDHNNNIIFAMDYAMWSQVRECAGLLQRGTSVNGRTFDIAIMDNESKRIVWEDATRNTQ